MPGDTKKTLPPCYVHRSSLPLSPPPPLPLPLLSFSSSLSPPSSLSPSSPGFVPRHRILMLQRLQDSEVDASRGAKVFARRVSTCELSSPPLSLSSSVMYRAFLSVALHFCQGQYAGNGIPNCALPFLPSLFPFFLPPFSVKYRAFLSVALHSARASTREMASQTVRYPLSPLSSPPPSPPFPPRDGWLVCHSSRLLGQDLFGHISCWRGCGSLNELEYDPACSR